MSAVEERLPIALRTEALEQLLVEKGLVDPAVMDKFISTYENDVGPLNGAKVVAKAWTDPEYRRRLLDDGTAAIAELGFKGPQGEHIVVVENDATRCTTSWSARCARATRGRCSACRRAGTRTRPTARGWCASRARCCPRWASTSPTTSRSRVWDSSSEVRYLVLPQRPAGTEALSEEQLAALVTRDAMVGVAMVAAP